MERLTPLTHTLTLGTNSVSFPRSDGVRGKPRTTAPDRLTRPADPGRFTLRTRQYALSAYRASVGRMTDRPDPTAVVVRRNIEGMLFLTRGNQSDLAESMRLVQGNVSRKLTGVATISLDDLDRIAAHFGITVADLVTPGCMPASHMIAVET